MLLLCCRGTSIKPACREQHMQEAGKQGLFTGREGESQAALWQIQGCGTRDPLPPQVENNSREGSTELGFYLLHGHPFYVLVPSGCCSAHLESKGESLQRNTISIALPGEPSPPPPPFLDSAVLKHLPSTAIQAGSQITPRPNPHSSARKEGSASQ